MRTATQDAARELLHAQLGHTNELVRTLISMEECRINTHHPDFLASRKKVKQLLAAADQERKRTARERKTGGTELALEENGSMLGTEEEERKHTQGFHRYSGNQLCRLM